MSARFSWKRGLLHGALAVLVSVAFGAGLAAAGLVADPERFGRGLGRFIGFAFGGGIGISYLFQAGKRTAGWAALGAVAALFAVLVAVVVVARARAVPKLSDAERGALVVEAHDGASWLVHPVLRVGVLHPGPGYADMPEDLFKGVLPKDFDARWHVWFDAEHRRMLLVMVTSIAPRSPAALEQFVAGIDDGMAPALASMAGGGELPVIDRDAREGEVSLHRGNDKAHLRIHALESARRTVVVVTMTPDGDDLAAVAQSLRRL